MKIHFVLMLMAICLFSFTCNKSVNNTIASTQNPDSKDGLQMPVSVGSSWKYLRIDSTEMWGPTGVVTYIIDSSEELVTVTGDTLISSIDPKIKLLVLSDYNVKSQTTDLTFFRYTKTNLTIYGRSEMLVSGWYTIGGLPSIPPAPYFDNYGDKLFFTSLPVTSTSFHLLDSLLINSNRGYDTTFVSKDTSCQVSGTNYLHAVYFRYTDFSSSFAPSGAGGFSIGYSCFIQPGIGIIFSVQPDYSVQGSVYNNNHQYKWVTRRLTESKIL
jgi:hypothetical protein